MSIQKPTVTKVAISPANYWPTQGWAEKYCIVNHVAQGSAQGTIAWFQNPAAQASSTHVIDLDGTVYEFLDPEDGSGRAPFGNGILASPDARALALWHGAGQTNPNYWSVAVEHAGKSGDVMPAKQRASSVALNAYYAQQFKIPVDANHLLPHAAFDSVNRAHCPGWTPAFWAAYIADVAAAVGTQPAPPPAPLPLFDDAARLQGCGYLAGGSSRADMISWLGRFSDA